MIGEREAALIRLHQRLGTALRNDPPDGRDVWKALIALRQWVETEMAAPAPVPADKETLRHAWRRRGHTFTGRLDRDCEVCGLPDRAPVHADRADARIVSRIMIPAGVVNLDLRDMLNEIGDPRRTATLVLELREAATAAPEGP